MTRRLPPPTRYVYVIGPAVGLQKIGIDTGPRGKLAALQTASPVKLLLHASVAVPLGAAHDVERRAHHRLRAARASGQWFDVKAVEAIEAIRIASSALLTMLEDAAPLPFFAFSRQDDASPPPERGLQRRAVRAELARIWQVARRSLVAG